MRHLLFKRKKIAIILLVIWLMDMSAPYAAYALTSGPAQPETQSFQPATVSDMVNLSNGQLKYNIPLLDIDGYPISLDYQPNTGIDDEASWVGLGWNVNTGAITRQVRGEPDDFSGDTVETDHYVKPKITTGGTGTAKVETFGISPSVSGSGSLTFGLFSDNYTGIGAEFGVNAGISYSAANSGALTAGIGLGVLSSTQSGVDVTPYLSLGVKEIANDNSTKSASLTGSFGYNTRSGIKSLTLGTSFGFSYADKSQNEQSSANYDLAGSTITYNTQPISPTITIPYTTNYSSYSFDVGTTAFAISPMVGGTGYQNVRQVSTIYNIKPGFGFLYADRGMNNPDAVMDFIRDNDNPIIPNIPNIAAPIPTPDIWSYTSQAGSGQFRLYRATGMFFDNQATDGGTNTTIGGDLGLGVYVHGGITYYRQSAKTTTRKWAHGGNGYQVHGDFQAPVDTAPQNQSVYFKQVGEKGLEDTSLDRQAHGYQAVEVAINDTSALSSFRNAGNVNGTPALPISSAIKRIGIRPQRTLISYLTAAEASQAGLYKCIPYYPFKDSTTITSLTATQSYDSLNRVDLVSNIRKAHHISEITVTADDGKRMVYGIPVYNLSQDEYSFAVSPSDTLHNGLVKVPPGITSPQGDPNGIDNYYHKEHKGAYASTFLLSAILSPDYVDKTGNGITDDDLGTAIKFNYSKLPYYYKWRSPYANASLNRQLMADPDDDKGSIIYGKKEIWYVQSIESKTKIAYFITGDRRDALGVAGWQYGNKDNTNTQKYLKQIRLYSKSDMSKPIKVVNFEYDYELCRKIPNSLDSGSNNPELGGKLTLTRVWFEYGNSDKGKYHPYAFKYNETIDTVHHVDTIKTPVYAYNSVDRWGNYKPSIENPKQLGNEQYPYTNQDTSYTNQNSALWHLSQVTLPTGGIINISYEAGDYAYVENQQATVMTPISSLINSSSNNVDTTKLNTATGIHLHIGTNLVPPSGVNQTTWFENNFLNGSNYIYTKLCIYMATNNYTGPNSLPYDYVPTYCQIAKVVVSSGEAYIYFLPISAGGVTTNPMSICAWQRLKNEYPRYAYPGFDSRVQSQNNSILAAVTELVDAVKELSELKKSLYQTANSNSYANRALLSFSFAKIAVSNGHKVGGPARVKKIQISDTWNTAGGPNKASSYGQAYTYTTTVNGQLVSSGVAAYEPPVGDDENALKQPVPYIQNIKGAINNYFDLEMPFCESLYPAPGITYSKVTVNDLDQTGNPSTKTGYIVNEFYTTKDFPVKVTALPISPYNPPPANHYSLTNTNAYNPLTLSQGYSVELNDMDGKTKATTIYDQSGAVISATSYVYNTQTDNSGNISLNNNVNVIDPATLAQSTVVLGRDVDFFTDFREQKSSNTGTAVNVGFDSFPVWIWPFFVLPHFPIHDDDEVNLFRSACAVKVIQNYGILSKTIKTENGSTITTQNMAFDKVTGEPVVTKTNNEFNRPIYSVNIPAYWAYNGMGPGYVDQGLLFSGLSTNASGEASSYGSFLQAGDELLDIQSGNHYWVIYNQAASGSGNTLKLIDNNGIIQANYAAAGLVKVVRSGQRNMLTANTTTIVCLNSPFTSDGHLQLISNGDLTAMHVINASATTYDNAWSGPGHVCPTATQYTDHDYHIANGDNEPYYGQTGMIITSTSMTVDTTDSVSVLNGCLNRSGIWVGSPGAYGSNYLLGTWLGVETCLNVPSAKTYFFGFAGDNGIKIYIDGVAVDSTSNNSPPPGSNSNYMYWYVRPHALTAGTHDLVIKFINDGTYAAAGLEIYDNTYSQLTNPDLTLSGLNRIFTTGSLLNTSTQSFIPESSGSLSYRYRYPNGTIPHIPCQSNAYIPSVNPYLTGYLGNWRPYQTKVFQQSRNYAFASNLNALAVDAKDAGYVNSFYSYWYSNGTALAVNPNSSRWVTANAVTLYDKYGQQLENQDALGRYSAANFDFNGELPSAVASNAMNREIYAASLEDSYFTFGSSGNTDTCNIREFMEPSTGRYIKTFADTITAHSGNYSAKMPSDGFTMATIIDTVHQKTTPYLTLDALKQYNTLTTTGLYPNGFEPYPGKTYVFDAWVNDGYPNDNTIRVALSINGNNVPLKCKAVVEGWKLVEGNMQLATLGHAAALNISVVPSSGVTVYIDDIRMFPFAAQMKTYAYDANTMRLMAELDENGFATFYEYDDEGLLIRVKKETERGIMTIKESRSTYRRNTTP